MIARTVDARGLSCPMPIVRLAREMKQAQRGEQVMVISDDEAFPAEAMEEIAQERLADGYENPTSRVELVLGLPGPQRGTDRNPRWTE